jgi:catechol 2,3-dioxygenase-like lactoylglutathione lyase family enzyme
MSERAFPIIYVDDVPAARAFYEALGFSQTYRFPAEGEPGYVTMSRAGSSTGIGAVGGAGEDRFGFWVYVDDVDIVFERLRASGALVVADPEDQPWGERVARIRDPGGHLVYLGAAL